MHGDVSTTHKSLGCDHLPYKTTARKKMDRREGIPLLPLHPAVFDQEMSACVLKAFRPLLDPPQEAPERRAKSLIVTAASEGLTTYAAEAEKLEYDYGVKGETLLNVEDKLMQSKANLMVNLLSEEKHGTMHSSLERLTMKSPLTQYEPPDDFAVYLINPKDVFDIPILSKQIKSVKVLTENLVKRPVVRLPPIIKPRVPKIQEITELEYRRFWELDKKKIIKKGAWLSESLKVPRDKLPVAYEARPPKVIFKEYEAGSVYEVRVQIVNVGLTHDRLILLPPNLCEITSGVFHVFWEEDIKHPQGGRANCPKTRSSILAPGMSFWLRVRFSPPTTRVFESIFHIDAEAGFTINVPIKGIADQAKLDLPSEIHLGSCFLGGRKEKICTVSNTGGLPGKFWLISDHDWYCHGWNWMEQVGKTDRCPQDFLLNCFHLKGTYFEIPSKSQSSWNLEIRFMPIQEAVHTIGLMLLCDNGISRQITITGKCIVYSPDMLTVDGPWAPPPQGCDTDPSISHVIHVDQDLIPNEIVMKNINLTNHGNVELKYEWTVRLPRHMQEHSNFGDDRQGRLMITPARGIIRPKRNVTCEISLVGGPDACADDQLWCRVISLCLIGIPELSRPEEIDDDHGILPRATLEEYKSSMFLPTPNMSWTFLARDDWRPNPGVMVEVMQKIVLHSEIEIWTRCNPLKAEFFPPGIHLHKNLPVGQSRMRSFMLINSSPRPFKVVWDEQNPSPFMGLTEDDTFIPDPTRKCVLRASTASLLRKPSTDVQRVGLTRVFPMGGPSRPVYSLLTQNSTYWVKITPKEVVLAPADVVQFKVEVGGTVEMPVRHFLQGNITPQVPKTADPHFANVPLMMHYEIRTRLAGPQVVFGIDRVDLGHMHMGAEQEFALELLNLSDVKARFVLIHGDLNEMYTCSAEYIGCDEWDCRCFIKCTDQLSTVPSGRESHAWGIKLKEESPAKPVELILEKPTGFLEPHNRCFVYLQVHAKNLGPVSMALEVQCVGSSTTHIIPVVGHVTRPVLTLQPSVLHLCEDAIYLNVRHQFVATLVNHSGVSGEFAWAQAIGKSKFHTRVEVEPSQGSVPAFGTMEICITLVAMEEGEVDDLWLPCCVEGCLTPLFTTWRGVVVGLILKAKVVPVEIEEDHLGNYLDEAETWLMKEGHVKMPEVEEKKIEVEKEMVEDIEEKEVEIFKSEVNISVPELPPGPSEPIVPTPSVKPLKDAASSKKMIVSKEKGPSSGGKQKLSTKPTPRKDTLKSGGSHSSLESECSYFSVCPSKFPSSPTYFDYNPPSVTSSQESLSDFLFCEDEEVQDQETAPQEQEEPAFVDFECVPLGKAVTRRLQVWNETPITTMYSVEAKHFPASNFDPQENLENRLDQLIKQKKEGDKQEQYLSHGKGLAFVFSPKEGVLEENGSMVVDITVHSDMWGTYEDNMIITFAMSRRPLIIPLRVHVEGCPLKFYLVPEPPPNIIRIGHHAGNVKEPLIRRAKIYNASPVPFVLNWQTLIDLGVEGEPTMEGDFKVDDRRKALPLEEDSVHYKLPISFEPKLLSIPAKSFAWVNIIFQPMFAWEAVQKPDEEPVEVAEDQRCDMDGISMLNPGTVPELKTVNLLTWAYMITPGRETFLLSTPSFMSMEEMPPVPPNSPRKGVKHPRAPGLSRMFKAQDCPHEWEINPFVVEATAAVGFPTLQIQNLTDPIKVLDHDLQDAIIFNREIKKHGRLKLVNRSTIAVDAILDIRKPYSIVGIYTRGTKIMNPPWIFHLPAKSAAELEVQVTFGHKQLHAALTAAYYRKVKPIGCRLVPVPEFAGRVEAEFECVLQVKYSRGALQLALLSAYITLSRLYIPQFGKDIGSVKVNRKRTKTLKVFNLTDEKVLIKLHPYDVECVALSPFTITPTLGEEITVPALGHIDITITFAPQKEVETVEVYFLEEVDVLAYELVFHGVGEFNEALLKSHRKK